MLHRGATHCSCDKEAAEEGTLLCSRHRYYQQGGGTERSLGTLGRGRVKVYLVECVSVYTLCLQWTE